MKDLVKVKTTNEYAELFGKSFKGEIVSRDKQDKHKCLVQEECGCSHWVDVTRLKPIDDNCEN